MEKYVKPVMEVIEFEFADVITASGDTRGIELQVEE